VEFKLGLKPSQIASFHGDESDRLTVSGYGGMPPISW